MDFTLSTYRILLTSLLNAGYSTYTFQEWCEGKAQGRFVILRHDVDLKAKQSLATAKIEASLGIKSSYYFRVVPQSNQPEIITAIADLGHEIGYHYEDLSIFKGDCVKALQHFETQLQYFRQFYPVKTICMHGSPSSKWDNKDLWKTNDYRDYGIIGEPYFDLLNNRHTTPKVLYLTDTARMWDGERYSVRDKVLNNQIEISHQGKSIHTTFELIDWLGTYPDQEVIMITTHPQRWTDNIVEWYQELILQWPKNRIKKMIFVKNI
jgi:hypothetical protein